MLVFSKQPYTPTREISFLNQNQYRKKIAKKKNVFRRVEVPLQKGFTFINEFDDLFDITHSDRSRLESFQCIVQPIVRYLRFLRVKLARGSAGTTR